MKKLKSGNFAVNFRVKDFNGKQINPVDFRGSKILLSFFRGASCPFCNMRLRELIAKHDEFKKNNLKVICFFNSTNQEITMHAGKQNAPFSIISDPNGEIYKLYGIESSHTGMLKAMMKPLKMIKMMTSGFFNMKSISDKPLIPADFLINESGLIHQAYYGKDFGDHIDLEEIKKWINNN